MDRTLGSAGGAAGEMQQRPVFGPGAGWGAVIRFRRYQSVERVDARLVPGAVGQQNLRQSGQIGAQRPHLALVQRRGGDQHPRLAFGQTDPDRLRAKGGKQRTEHRAGFPGSQGGDVQFGNASRQRADPVALDRAQPFQQVGELIAEASQLRVSHFPPLAVFAQPDQRDRCAPSRPDLPIHRLPSDVDAAVGQTLQLGPRRRPGKTGPRRRVVGPARRRLPRFCDRANRRSGHLDP